MANENGVERDLSPASENDHCQRRQILLLSPRGKSNCSYPGNVQKYFQNETHQRCQHDHYAGGKSIGTEKKKYWKQNDRNVPGISIRMEIQQG